MSSATAAVKKPAATPQAPPALDAGSQAIKQAMSEVRLDIVPLLANELWAREAGVKFNTWEVVPNAGVPFEHLLEPSFWSNVARKLRPGDSIIAFPRDGQWYGQLLVWDAGQNWAQVSGGCMARPNRLAVPGVDDAFEIRRDPVDGWCVYRRATSDKAEQKLKAGFANSEDSRKWLIDHQKAMRT